MKQVLSTRKHRIGFFRKAKDLLIARELRDRANELNAERGMPIVVFGNDWLGIMINIDGAYEKQYLDDLKSIISQNNIETKTAIDIGANIGNHSLIFSSIFDSVVAYEPNPRVFNVLKANSDLINNLKVHNFGCSNTDRNIDLHENFANIGSSSAIHSIGSDSTVKINVRPLDDLADELTAVSFIKIDVEGMELECLEGSQKIISKFKPLIMLEQLEQEFSSEYRETAAIDWLRNNGYKIFALEKDPEISVTRRILNLLKIAVFPEETRKIVEYEKLPRAKYNALYAIHSEAVAEKLRSRE